MGCVRVENATKDYTLGRTTVPAVRGVSPAIAKEESIAGPSRRGETTLLGVRRLRRIAGGRLEA